MDLSTLIQSAYEFLEYNSIIIALLSIITLLTSFLFPLCSKRFINLSNNAFDEKADKPLGIMMFIFYIISPIEIIFLKTSNYINIEIALLILLGFSCIIATKAYEKESQKVSTSFEEFYPNTSKFWVLKVLTIMILFIVGFINIMILTKDYNIYKSQYTNFNIAISLGFKFLLFYISTIVLCGYLYSISIINNLKKYTLIGDELTEIREKVDGTVKNEVTGYIIGTTDKEIILRPHNCSLIIVKKDDIKCIKYEQ